MKPIEHSNDDTQNAHIYNVFMCVVSAREQERPNLTNEADRACVGIFACRICLSIFWFS